MTFALSQRSKSRLLAVHPKLVKTVERAIEITDVDFGISEGLRTLETQKHYVATGKSQTMNSKHLRQDDGFSHAVDLVAYISGQVSWELNVYDNICDAMKRAARDVGCGLRWGAAWNVPDITLWSGTAEEARMSYIDTRRSQGRRPFIDGPHFELAI